MSLVKMKPIKLSAVNRSVNQLRDLLSSRDELAERAHLDGFFRKRPWLLGFYVASADKTRGFPQYFSKKEFRIAGVFRTDFLYTWPTKKNVVAVEIEGAKKGSIFEVRSGKWSKDFNCGFNQVIDWMHWFDSTSDVELKRHFDFAPKHFDGLLIIGRRKFVESKSILKERYDWRKNAMRVHIKDTVRTIKILTYDDLLDEITEALSICQEQRKFLDS